MKRLNMKKLKKDQRGLTLVELLIAILLTGLITGGITMTIFQVFNLNTRTSNHMTAVRQVQHAGFWVSPDVQMAQPDKINDDPPGGKFLVLGWTAQDGKEHEVDYTLENMSSGEFKILWRKHYIDIGSGPELDSTIKVAEYIDPDQTIIDPDEACYFPDCGAFIFKVTATVGGQSETREYEVKPRPGS